MSRKCNISFSCNRESAPRDLHSFPTRRSSDLGAFHHVIRIGGDRWSAWLLTRRSLELAGPIRPRSEEHTSELQSPDHFVCRLLLEKKNKLSSHRSFWSTMSGRRTESSRIVWCS